jgi:hypothetical protein
MLTDEYATVKDAVNRGVGLDQAVKILTFPHAICPNFVESAGHDDHHHR